MRGIFEYLKQSHFVRNVSLLASGTIVVQGISVLISPVLSRLYTPEDYGLLAVFVSCLSVLTVVGSFRYELAILIPKKNSEAKALLKLSLLITSVFAFIVFLVTLFFNYRISILLGNEQIQLWLYFLGPVFLAAGFTQALTCWHNRNKNYKIISGVRIYQSSINSGLSILFGFLKLNTFGLLVGLIISQLSSPLIFLKKSSFKFHSFSFDFTKLKALAKKYVEFPKYSLPSALLDTISINSIILILSYFFSESVTGSYSFALRLLSLPAIVIGASIGQVFFQRISEAYSNKENITGLITKSWKLLFMIGIVPSLIIFFFGEELFIFIFGVQWTQAGLISKYLCILTLFTFISSPTSNAMIVLGKQKFLLLVNILAFIYRPLALFWGYYTNNFLNGIILYIVLEVVQIIYYNYTLIKSARQSDAGK